MTEVEWLACTDPVGLLGCERLQPTERKLRLFAAACCRRTLAAVPVRSLDAAVATVERFADGRATAEDLAAAGLAADGIGDGAGNTADYHAAHGEAEAVVSKWQAASCAGWAVYSATCPGDQFMNEIWRLPRLAAEAARLAVSSQGERPARWDGEAERAAQSRLLRDITGSPFHPARADPSWLTPAVEGMARAIYAGRAFDGLPALADALHDAGCGDAALLSHCRSDGPHVLGCWAIDLLLGKQ